MAAPSSQSGKTTITCALLELLKEKGLGPVSFKCGPDYIDPMFHKKVLGIDSRNLDTFFVGTTGIRRLMEDCRDGYAVIEGVMGLYDGIGADSMKGSGYEVANALKAPIILVVDASGVGRTVISIIKGMLLDDEHHLIKGIILNKMSKAFYESIRPVMERELYAMRDDVRILGFFPKNPDLGIESRHLGLKLPGEIADIKNKLSLAAAALEENVDIKAVLEIMKDASILEYGDAENGVQEWKEGDGLTLAVASDDAFCFYYKENLELFEKFGVRLTFFSPVKDDKLPEGIDGLLIGGGYPENYLKELSTNKSMLESIKNAIRSGLPSLAECGGFMYLHRKITDKDGTDYEMVGAINGECSYTGRLVRFGYMEIESVNMAKGTALEESLVGMKGHEFHYYDSTCNGDAVLASKPTGNRHWNCIIAENNGIWGFPHFYYESDPEFVRAFISRMKEVKNG